MIGNSLAFFSFFWFLVFAFSFLPFFGFLFYIFFFVFLREPHHPQLLLTTKSTPPEGLVAVVVAVVLVVLGHSLTRRGVGVDSGAGGEQCFGSSIPSCQSFWIPV